MERGTRLIDMIKTNSETNILAVWGPKPGDGVSMTAEAITQMLWERREKDELIGLLDYNTRTPYIKYRLGLDEYYLLDDLLPFISADKLTPEILSKYAVDIYQKIGMQFIGGIKRPEFNGRYNYIHFDSLLDTAKRLYHKTVIDAGNILDIAGTVTALKRADYILAVLQPSFVSKQCLKQSLSLFPALGINPNKVGIVYNRYQDNDEKPQIMVAGLNLEVLGTLNELGSDKNFMGHSWLLDDKRHKNISAYRENLKNILEACKILPAAESNKKVKILPRLFAREV